MRIIRVNLDPLVQKIVLTKVVQLKRFKPVRNKIKAIKLMKINILKNKVMKIHSLAVKLTALVKEKMIKRLLGEIKQGKTFKFIGIRQSITSYRVREANWKMSQRMTELPLT